MADFRMTMATELWLLRCLFFCDLLPPPALQYQFNEHFVNPKYIRTHIKLCSEEKSKF